MCYPVTYPKTDLESRKPQLTQLTSRDCALIAAAAADSKKGTDILIQDVSNLLDVTDYFVIISAQNDRQVEAISDEVEEKLREKAGIKPYGREGLEDCRWVLLDFGEMVVHIFQEETRDYYRLETIWNDAPLVDVSEAGIEYPDYSERIAKLVDAVLKNQSGEGDSTEAFEPGEEAAAENGDEAGIEGSDEADEAAGDAEAEAEAGEEPASSGETDEEPAHDGETGNGPAAEAAASAKPGA